MFGRVKIRLVTAAAMVAAVGAPWGWPGAADAARPRGAGASGGSAPWPCSYSVTYLHGPAICQRLGAPFPVPAACTANVVNQHGEVAGDQYGCVPINARPFFWTPDGGYQLPPAPPGSSNSPVTGMNAMREIVGVGNFPQVRGYMRRVNGQYLVLPTSPAGNWSEAFDISGDSLVVGFWANVVTGIDAVPCAWRDGVLVDLSHVLPGPFAKIQAINSRGQMTGWTGLGDVLDARAFILDDGEVTILPPIPGGVTSEGFAINARSDVAGRCRFASPPGSRRAALWADGKVVDLGSLPGLPNSTARSMNSHRVIVGGASDSATRGFVWQDGVMRNLTDLIPASLNITIQIAQSINDAGLIAATAYSSVLGNTAVLLTPVYQSPADLNDDCYVNGQDLAILIESWGPIGRDANPAADIDASGIVNGIDLAILLGEWG